MPMGMAVARFARVPLIGLRELSQVPMSTPFLSVCLGPFDVVHDDSHSYWHALKAVVGGVTVAAVICRMSNKGDGGVHLVKLWVNEPGRYIYHGDPAGERFLPPQEALKIVCEHLAAEYHVGFPEDPSAKAHDDAIVNNSQPLLESEQERLRREMGLDKEPIKGPVETVERAIPPSGVRR